MKLIISRGVRTKLSSKLPPVTETEIVECFSNRTGAYLIDTRANNLTNPLTRWFVAETNFGRRLKIAFVPDKDGIHIKTAYDPNIAEVRIYNAVCQTGERK